MRKPSEKAKLAPPRAPAIARLPPQLLAALLALVTLAIYWPAKQCEFIGFDDPEYVTANSHVQGGVSWDGLAWVLRTPIAANWHPLTLLSHMVDCQLFGLNALGHHMSSALPHAFNSALVLLLLRRLTGALWRSLLVAALFALHPLRVESVAWVAERKDVLSTCFGLLCLMAYARCAEDATASTPVPRRRSGYYALALLLLALGLMSKAMLVTWPLVMLLLDFWPLGRMAGGARQLGRLVLEKTPFFALVAAASVVTLVVQQREGAVKTVANLSLAARGENALIAYCRYLGKLFWPRDLAFFYPHPGSWPILEVLLAGGLLLSITVVLVVKRKRYPFLLMGWLWYCGTLVPALGLVQVGEQAMADRYSYIPSIGMLIFAIWGVHELTRSWRFRVLGVSVAASAVIVVGMALTRQQLGYWRNSEALFRHAIEVTENNYLAHDLLGVALGRQGRADEAITELQEAIRLRPAYAEAHSNLGAALGAKGQLDEAIGQLQETIRLKPDYAEAHNNLGVAFDRQGRVDEAVSHLQEAIRLKPASAATHFNLGNALLNDGQVDEAILQFQQAIRLKPDDANARNNLARAQEMGSAPMRR